MTHYTAYWQSSDSTIIYFDLMTRPPVERKATKSFVNSKLDTKISLVAVFYEMI